MYRRGPTVLGPLRPIRPSEFRDAAPKRTTFYRIPFTGLSLTGQSPDTRRKSGAFSRLVALFFSRLVF